MERSAHPIAKPTRPTLRHKVCDRGEHRGTDPTGRHRCVQVLAPCLLMVLCAACDGHSEAAGPSTPSPSIDQATAGGSPGTAIEPPGMASESMDREPEPTANRETGASTETTGARDGSSPASAPPAGNQARASTAPTSTPTSTPSPAPTSGEPTTTDLAPAEVQERCIASPCEPSILPEQPDLPFLEDMGDGWVRLMEVEWHVGAGAEGYRCRTFTVPEDIHVTAFFPQVPLGTHHLGFDVSAVPTRPDGLYACGVSTVGERKLQGAGIGSEPTELPDGVAMPLLKGQQLFLNLHLFNASTEALQGRSGMWVRTVPAEEVVHRAEVILAGPLNLQVPPGRSTQSGHCTLRADATLYGIAPHMHQTGVHTRATLVSTNGEQTVLFDGPHDFEHQLWYTVEERQLHAGDRVDIECTYENDTSRTIPWGDSALDEMCFVNLSVYPAIGYGAGVCED